MFTFDQAMRLARLQGRIWNALAEALREDGHRKSNDGMIELTYSMPAAFNHDKQPSWVLTICSYVLCDQGRSETFSAPSIEGALSMAEAYVSKICMGYEFRAFERAVGDGGGPISALRNIADCRETAPDGSDLVEFCIEEARSVLDAHAQTVTLADDEELPL